MARRRRRALRSRHWLTPSPSSWSLLNNGRNMAVVRRRLFSPCSRQPTATTASSGPRRSLPGQPEPICKVQRTSLQSRPVSQRPLLSSVAMAGSALELGAIGSPRWRAAATTSRRRRRGPCQRAAAPPTRAHEPPRLFSKDAATKFLAYSADDPAGVGHHAPEVRRTWASCLRHGVIQLPRGRKQLPNKLTKTTKSSVCPIWTACSHSNG